ncbi:MAG: SDR family oxidoreductase [Candidatus Lokiarchaeota archaeon]|nr:SDR family oxidoreductase [Candidatus Lokiarchaeota archaeon]
MTNILVTGISGMLGSMVFNYLSRNSEFNVFGTVRNSKFLNNNIYLFDAYDISQLERKEILELNVEYIINCIGITKPFSKDDDPEGVMRAIKINAEFPWQLAKYAKKYNIKVIQIGTDCVYSGKEGNYSEDAKHDPLDVYGKSKSLGEVFDGTTLIIRSSIIGPELKKETTFLLEWFLTQPEGGIIGGFEHHIWNGITTLQFAEICEKIIYLNKFDDLLKISNVHHFIPNATVNKYELMNIFNEIFQKRLIINRINKPDETVDRTLSTKFNELSSIYQNKDMIQALRELKDYFKNL